MARRNAQQARERAYVESLLAERETWIRKAGTSGWQAERNRRRAALIQRSRTRRKGATPLPAPEPCPQLSLLSDLGDTA